MIIRKTTEISNIKNAKANLLLNEDASSKIAKNKFQLNNQIKNSHSNPNFGSAASSAPWFYRSKAVKWILDSAADKQLIFDAAFALVLTCLLRPASIVVLPSKKNKEDQKYAAAHSIASGIIGFIISTLAFLPISKAIEKMKNNPENYVKEKSLLVTKDGANQMNKTAKTYIDRLPDILGAVPKGILTIALIPPILKYVFGVDKKSKNDANKLENELIYPDYSLLNFKHKENNIYQNFMGGRK